MSRVTAALICILLLAMAVRAQEAGCPVSSMAVVVALEDGRVARGMAADKFVTRLRGKELAAKVAGDTSPRRILLLLDLSKDVNSEAWKVAMEAAEHLAQKARQEDQLALRTFGSESNVTVAFDEPRATLQVRLAELRAKRPPMGEGSFVNDAAMEGLALFGPPKFGDTILLIAGGPDTRSRTGEGELLRALQSRHTRMFGFVLTRFRIDTPGPAALEQQLSTSDATHSLLRFTNQTGGDLMADNTAPFNRPYVVNDERLEKVRTLIWRLYGQIVDVYRFEVPGFNSVKAEDLKIEVVPEIRKRFPGIVVRHVARLAPCNN